MMLFPLPTIKCLSLFPGLFAFIYSSTFYLSLSLSSREAESYIGFEVLTAMIMKSTIFCDITLCNPLKVTDVSEEPTASIFRVED
jgi:hypothetical protein